MNGSPMFTLITPVSHKLFILPTTTTMLRRGRKPAPPKNVPPPPPEVAHLRQITSQLSEVQAQLNLYLNTDLTAQPEGFLLSQTLRQLNTIVGGLPEPQRVPSHQPMTKVILPFLKYNITLNENENPEHLTLVVTQKSTNRWLSLEIHQPLDFNNNNNNNIASFEVTRCDFEVHPTVRRSASLPSLIDSLLEQHLHKDSIANQLPWRSDEAE